MSIFVIADLHLSFKNPKPMDIFGDNWTKHEEKIKKDWNEKVKEEDLVVLPGDFSWATYIEDTIPDFEYLNSLPGKKIMLKGNHDYYFSTKTKVEKYFKENGFDTISVLHNDAIETNECIVAGTRGWGKTESSDKALDKKIILREENRLILSLEKAKKIQEKSPDKQIIVAMHFPPFIGNFQKIMKDYDIKKCIYGHLHGYGHFMVKEGIIDGIEYKMVSCDYTKFNMVKL